MRQSTPPITDLTAYTGKYVLPVQLARYARVAKRTIYYHIQKGALPAVRVGGPGGRILRIPIAEARAYVRQTVQPVQ